MMKNETRGLTCGSISSMCQDDLKSANLPHKMGFVVYQVVGTVGYNFCKVCGKKGHVQKLDNSKRSTLFCPFFIKLSGNNHL